jgi:peptidoglycan/xylan/chitin deacetylase (PgdA/CDA1 family)
MDLRLDRLATLYLVSPFRRLASEKHLSIPILMYHSIAEEDESGVHAYYRTSTAPGVFAAQMEQLHRDGYSTCSMAQAVEYLLADMHTAIKAVVITFDDGYRDFYTKAFPVLNRYGFNATVFLPTAYIGESPVQFKGRECLTWQEARTLQRHGILFGSHTVTHPQLFGLSAHAIDEEIVNSKKTIEEKLGCAVNSFAYPFAFPQTDTDFKKRVRDSLQRAGYENGVCTIVGRANRRSELFFLERLPVNSCDDAALFAAKLAGAYDWVSSSQYLSKMAKASLRGSFARTKFHVSTELSRGPQAR